VFHSLEDAIEKAKKEDPEEVCVIGGADIYRQTLPLADIIYFTRVYTEIEGDAFFPEIDEQEWEKVSEERHENDDEHEYPFSFETYKRRK
jgi:dihydrofolate reductase